jgi:hypothetical protein
MDLRSYRKDEDVKRGKIDKEQLLWIDEEVTEKDTKQEIENEQKETHPLSKNKHSKG